MSYKIIWAPSAKLSVKETRNYLKNRWSKKVADEFLTRVDEVVNSILDDPYTYRFIAQYDVYEVVVTKHNILNYTVAGKSVENRQLFRHPPGS